MLSANVQDLLADGNFLRTAYHLLQNKYSYKSEIKSKTIGLYQITGVTAYNNSKKFLAA